MKKWQLQEAKNRLSELVRKATEEGPQVITVRGEDAVVVVKAADYRKLAGSRRERLVEFLQKSPLANSGLVIERSKDAGRKVDF